MLICVTGRTFLYKQLSRNDMWCSNRSNIYTYTNKIVGLSGVQIWVLERSYLSCTHDLFCSINSFWASRAAITAAKFLGKLVRVRVGGRWPSLGAAQMSEDKTANMVNWRNIDRYNSENVMMLEFLWWYFIKGIFVFLFVLIALQLIMFFPPSWLLDSFVSGILIKTLLFHITAESN